MIQVQADGQLALEPGFPVAEVARAVVYLAGLPEGTNVAEMTIMSVSFTPLSSPSPRSPSPPAAAAAAAAARRRSQIGSPARARLKTPRARSRAALLPRACQPRPVCARLAAGPTDEPPTSEVDQVDPIEP